MNASERKSFKRVQDSQTRWKAKAIERNKRLRAANVRIRDLEHSRQMWRDRSHESHEQSAQPSVPAPVGETVATSVPPEHLHALIVCLCINVTVNCAVSFRAVPKILALVQQVLQACGLTWTLPIPHFTTIIRWTLRVGIFLLNNAITRTVARWICIIDHTIQVGTKKAFAVLRVPVDAVTTGQAFTLKDVEVLYLKVQATWNGTEVQKVLEHVFSRVGPPQQIVLDGGPDLQKGLKNLLETGRFTFKVTADITHFIANLLKHKYHKHDRFQTLLTHLSTTKSKILQTSLAYLSPLKARTKSRFLNLPAIAKWTKQMLTYLTSLPELTVEEQSEPEHQKHQELVQTHFAWLIDYQDVLTPLWTELQALTQIQQLVKTTGLTDESDDRIRTWLLTLPDASIREPLETYLQTEFAFQTHASQPLLLTSDIIESLFGNYKFLAKPHSLSEINRMIFALPCFCEDITPDLINVAFSGLSNTAAEQHYRQEIPETLLSKRRKAFRSEQRDQPLEVLDTTETIMAPFSKNDILKESIATEYSGQETVGTPLARTG
jgi:hypothetical protein